MARPQQSQGTPPPAPSVARVRRLVHGYLRMEEPNEAQTSLWRQDLSTFCLLGYYQLGSVFIDRGVPDEVFARTGFTKLLEALRQPEAYAVVVPSLDHLSGEEFVRDALQRMVLLTESTVLVACEVNGSMPTAAAGQDIGSPPGPPS